MIHGFGVSGVETWKHGIAVGAFIDFMIAVVA
jgi:hypothetical protein